jgi:hypothetical protein
MLEGWFKAELLCLFTKLGRPFEAEKQFSRPDWKRPRRVDFSIVLDGVEHLIEIKACVLEQRGLKFYFGKDYIPHDAAKLRELDSSPDFQRGAKKHLLAFIYPSPGVDEWEALLKERQLQSPDNAFVRSPGCGMALINIP